MCIRDSHEIGVAQQLRNRTGWHRDRERTQAFHGRLAHLLVRILEKTQQRIPVSYTHLRAHETVLDLVCRLLIEKKTNTTIPD